MPFSDGWWAELAQADLSDMQMAVSRFIKEREASNPQAAVDAIMAAIRAALPESEEEPPRLLQAADFIEQAGDAPVAIAEGMLPANRLIVLGGDPKQGKSLVALEMLHRVAEGNSLMEKFRIDVNGPVVYFGFEDGAYQIKERLQLRGIVSRDIPFYICERGFDFNRVEGFETFKTLVAGLPDPPSLVVIDTAREAYLSMKDWNDSTKVTPAISPLRRWAHEHCCVILLAHYNKNPMAAGVNKLSGSNALPAAADSIMYLDKKKRLANNGLRWEFEMDDRGGLNGRYLLELDPENLHIRVLEADEVEEEKRARAREARPGQYAAVKAAIGQLGVEATSDRIQEVTVFSKSLVHNLVKEMLDDGQIVDSGTTFKAEGKRQAAAVYAVLNGESDSEAEELFGDDESAAE